MQSYYTVCQFQFPLVGSIYLLPLSGNAGHFHTNPRKREEEFNQESKMTQEITQYTKILPWKPLTGKTNIPLSILLSCCLIQSE
jgi:hypothetical protein